MRATAAEVVVEAETAAGAGGGGEGGDVRWRRWRQGYLGTPHPPPHAAGSITPRSRHAGGGGASGSRGATHRSSTAVGKGSPPRPPPSASAPVPEKAKTKLKEKLAGSMGRMSDLFKQDVDGNGQIDKARRRRGAGREGRGRGATLCSTTMISTAAARSSTRVHPLLAPRRAEAVGVCVMTCSGTTTALAAWTARSFAARSVLGLDAPQEDLDALFDEMDGDGRSVDFKELNRMLRQGANVKLAAELRSAQPARSRPSRATRPPWRRAGQSPTTSSRTSPPRGRPTASTNIRASAPKPVSARANAQPAPPRPVSVITSPRETPAQPQPCSARSDPGFTCSAGSLGTNEGSTMGSRAGLAAAECIGGRPRRL